MIKIDNINVLVDGSEYSAKVEIPSQVTTSTPQEETVDLAKTPNLFIKVVDPDNTLKIGVNVEAQLTTEEGTYTMICDVVSKNQMYTTLQYAYGMTFEADDSSDDGSSDDPDEPTGPSFTYDGSDQNNPIICNVKLRDNDDDMDGISLNISVDGATTIIDDHLYWTPDMENGILSNDNDFKIECYGSLNSPPMEPRDNQWFTGTRTAGTYLKSYTITYTYNNSDGDEDPVMQQLDGTSITFWVQYNVTDR